MLQPTTVRKKYDCKKFYDTGPGATASRAAASEEKSFLGASIIKLFTVVLIPHTSK
jgi:hypothetical protein